MVKMPQLFSWDFRNHVSKYTIWNTILTSDRIYVRTAYLSIWGMNKGPFIAEMGLCDWYDSYPLNFYLDVFMKDFVILC